MDAFVARLDASLATLDQATYLGGSRFEEILALAIAPATGEVYVAGGTTSTDFASSSCGAQSSFGGAEDVFVARLSADLAGPASAQECADACGREKKVCIWSARTTNLACKLECRTDVECRPDARPQDLGACMRGCTATFRAVQDKCRSDHTTCLGTCQPRAGD